MKITIENADMRNGALFNKIVEAVGLKDAEDVVHKITLSIVPDNLIEYGAMRLIRRDRKV